MSLLFFKRVLANPIQVGYLVPSSGFLTRRTAKRIDFSKPRVVVELGPGEGCHTRQIVRAMRALSVADDVVCAAEEAFMRAVSGH